MIFFGLLRRLCKKHLGDEFIANTLVSGGPEIKSRQAVNALAHLVKKIPEFPQLSQVLLSQTSSEAWEILSTRPVLEPFHRLCVQYLSDFGVRSIEEMKLETLPMKDNPPYLCTLLAGALRNPGAPLETSSEASGPILRSVKGLSGIIFRLTAAMAKEGVRDRENQRFCRSEIYAVVRDLSKSIGRRLVQWKMLQNSEDVFWLEFEEMWSALSGKLTVQNLDLLVQARKTEYSSYASILLPNRIETEGGVYSQLDREILDPSKLEAVETLRGTPTGHGVVEGRVRVLYKPDVQTRLSGEILVAPYTDPGWALLFPSISGLVVERGSLLSHSAIIAREMNLPALVGVENACILLHDGDLIRLDGRQGLILILERAP